MSHTPFAHAESLHIGTVEFISPDEVKVLLDIEAPDSVALNAGGVRPFPRVNGYVLLPVDDGYLVGQIEWLTIERSAFPKRRGVQDFGLIDLPYPLRRMSLNPVGTLRNQGREEERYVFRRGADALPSVGSAVLLPTEKQLRAIVESGERRHVRIGTSPLASNAEVRIDPDRLFGRHLAVLGNTGSGKSCSVAGLIRWSLEAAQFQRQAKDKPNARFVVLDPNGEYSRAFSGTGSNLKARIFKINPDVGERALQVPLWFWNSAEWASFTQASAKTQRPLLKRALREVKAGRVGAAEPTVEERKLELRRYLSSMLITIQRDLRSGVIKTEETKFGYRLQAILRDLERRNREFPYSRLAPILVAIRNSLQATLNSFVKDGKTIEYYRAFSEEQVTVIVDEMTAALGELGGIIYQDGPSEDIPIAFKGTDLADHLQILSTEENVSQFLDFLISRIRTFLSDSKISSVVSDSGAISLKQWLADYIGGCDATEGQLAILDLSLVPTEIVHVIAAVAARMIFEALQRYRMLNKVVLPTVLVMEEAHTFIRRYKDDVESYDAATVCCQVFERIAREGRKFGLGLVLSSQRPSELSPTVLSQCNTFLLHRISNDRDQELVHRLVPDNLRGLLRELPSLPSQNAILLGWASELPVLVRIDDLPKTQQPHSEDPDFWNVWTGKDAEGNVVERKADWKPIADDWQGK
ncbi:MAG: ATP-binding protein [Candidatus Zixiibacteriota bacterium]